MKTVQLLVDGNRGVYVPKAFADNYENYMVSPNKEDIEILKVGPDHEHYWETWDDVESSLLVTDDDGDKFFLHQDGDLWAIPEGMEWNEEKEEWIWPEIAPDQEEVYPEDKYL